MINIKSILLRIDHLKLLFVVLVSATVIAACGGSGSSSNAGGGSGLVAGKAAISGNVSNSNASLQDSSALDSSTLNLVLGKLITEAHATGVAGVTVQLLLSGAVVDSQQTDANGNFSFVNLAPGSYSIALIMDGENIGNSPAVELNADTITQVELSLTGGINELEVNAANTTISGSVDDDSSDDGSSDDNSSDDDISSEDDDSSEDDVSSEDDDSSDD